MQSFAVTLVGYAALPDSLQRLGISVLALCVATIPATVAEMRFSKLAFRVRNWRSPESRRLLYLEYVLANDEHAKEVKLFGLGPMLLGRYRKTSRGSSTGKTSASTSEGGRRGHQALSLVGTGAFYGAYAAMAVLAAAGKLTLGNMTMYVIAFRQGQQSFQSVLGSIGGIYEHNLYMSNLWEYLAMGSGRERSSRPRLRFRRRPRLRPPGIVLEDVGFRYAGKEAWALRHIDLTIPSGERRARRENGAGKTTLIDAPLRAGGPHPARRPRSARLASRRAAQAVRRALPGLQSVPAAGSRERGLRERGAPGRRAPHRARDGARRRVRARVVAAAGARRAARALVQEQDRAVGRSSGRRSPWREPSCARTPTSSSSTSPRRRSTPRRNTRCSRAFASWRRGGRRSSSHRFP